MIALVEGAERQKTPNEIALNILLAGMTIIFVFAVVTHPELRRLCRRHRSRSLVLVALFVTLIPTTIGALLSAIGIAGMDRLVRFNVLAMSGRAVEAAGDVDTLLLDKTGTITLGNRQATEFMPVPRRHRAASWPTRRSSPRCRDETPEGRSIVVLAKEKYGLRGREMAPLHAQLRPVHRADPHERRRRRRRARSARARSTRSSPDVKASTAAASVAARARSAVAETHRQVAAARRWPSPRTAACSASSTSRTSSRAASASASPSCAGWASAR